MIRFVDILGRTLPRNRIKDVCEAMLLSDEESYLLMHRFACMMTAEQCDRVSVQRQRKLVPILNTKVQLWFDSCLGDEDTEQTKFFSDKELRAIQKALSAHKKDLLTEIEQKTHKK